jgi:hypothetical protein
MSDEQLKLQLRQANAIIHNMVVANQAAWIEWQHGKGADSAMHWIHNGLVGPGHIPVGEDAQAFFDLHVVEFPMPTPDTKEREL